MDMPFQGFFESKNPNKHYKFSFAARFPIFQE